MPLVLIMLLSLSGKEGTFKSTKINCSDITYTWEWPTKQLTGIKTNKAEYTSQYTDIDSLQTEVDKQCKLK